MWLIVAAISCGFLDAGFALPIVVALGVLQLAVDFREFGVRRGLVGLGVGLGGVALAVVWVMWFGGR
ncbi:MAG: hypothetical protein AB7T63_11995 [Planctomycetota bacterium]